MVNVKKKKRVKKKNQKKTDKSISQKLCHLFLHTIFYVLSMNAQTLLHPLNKPYAWSFAESISQKLSVLFIFEHYFLRFKYECTNVIASSE